ncbi:hypothetical protein QN277_011541 [Acacia crassicarpa]|uniref:HEAT repeat-containing protein 5B n=2 Tax=Acacia crassicarpa TaxID=499986 RepID=A0AAE1TDH2_9FABA|nr:hypothetical protein QN277_011541 [Acacia crassicarpa]
MASSMAKNLMKDNVPLSRFGVLAAQLESIVASAAQQSPDPLLCFDLLSDLISAIDEGTKDSVLSWQRRCEDALYSLLVIGARRPVRHLASVAMAKIISKGDGISIYSRASSLQGFLSDVKRSEPQRVAGAAHCLGELYRHFGRRITSGLLETTIIASKLLKFNEEFVRHEALHMLRNALEGSGGNAASSAYAEAYRIIVRYAIGEKSFSVRIVAARCLNAFANIGGPGLGVAELDNSASYCVKALEDPVSSVRDAFSEALASLLALGMNPEAQVQLRGKGPSPPPKKLEGGLQKHLILAFRKASGVHCRNVRVGLTLSWVFFLQAIRIKYLHPDSELQNFASPVMEMLDANASVDAHALACVLYILRVGVTDQMTEPTQRNFLVFLGMKLESPEAGASVKVAALRTLSYTLKTLGEVPLEFKEVLDNTVVAAVSDSSKLVRIEAALTLRALAEVDPTCVGGLTSYGVTTLTALRESLSFEKGSSLQFELDSLHGQATVLAALVTISPKLPLGYPARLPRSVLGVSKRMLTEHSRNPVAAIVEQEAGWLLLSSLLSSLTNEELEEEVFDILSLWATLFTENPENEVRRTGDLISRINVWSAAVDALSAFIRCFLSCNVVNDGVLLQPILVYLSRALSYVIFLRAKELPNVKSALDIFTIRTLIAYQSLPDPGSYKSDHQQIIQLCTTPFRHASGCEESSCLRLLLDKRDAWLGPWIPGRDWFEDELRAFQGGKDGLMPCVWENELSSFPQPETISKTLVNQMLLFFGTMFASQNSGGMLSLLGIIDQCLKSGKKQHWHAASVTNACVGLLAGFKSLLSRPQAIGQDILGLAQSILQGILVEGDICASQRRASAEGLGYLARLGNDIFTARMTRSLLGDLNVATDSNYAGSIAFALGCIHHSAGGIALSTLVPATVSSISSLAKSSVANLQIWSMHGLLLTIEAAGLSYVSHVQGTLGLAMDILLSDENGLVDIQQGVARLINAIVAVLGPELAPGSIFFSRCKSVVAEISCRQETATMLESACFTQQLVLFAPQAVSVHSHVQTLLSTLSSRQPTLRHLAISTLRHLIEKDPDSVIVEHIEDNLFIMLDEETDSEIGNLVQTAIIRLLYASGPSSPSHWISTFRKVVLATSVRNIENNNKAGNDKLDADTRLNFGDDENMVSSSSGNQGYKFEASIGTANRERHLRYRTRLFAAECLSHLPDAVGRNPAHFDLFLARKHVNDQASSDWLVLHLQELISLAYQISTIQFENMQPVGVGLLGTIVDKFEKVADPELPGHLLLEQYQAQLVSAVRTTLDTSSSPSLLEAGLHLATKILTSGIISGDQAVVKRLFSLISRPLHDFENIYYPSFAEWVTSKIKIRLLAAHASLKCYIYASMRKHEDVIPEEYLALLPLFQKSSSILGKYWIRTLKDYSYVCLCLSPKRKWNLFLEGLQSPVASSKLQPCLEESWPVILQALALDAVPMGVEGNGFTKASTETIQKSRFASEYSMVELTREDFQFLWGFSLLSLFQSKDSSLRKPIIRLASIKAMHGSDLPTHEENPSGPKLYEIVLLVFQFLLTPRFSGGGFLTMDICKELLQILSYSTYLDSSWNSLAISVLSQVVQNCPQEFFDGENFSYLAVELCFYYLFKVFQSTDSHSVGHPMWEENVIRTLCSTIKVVMHHVETKMQKQSKSVVLGFILSGYRCIKEASTEFCLSEAIDVVNCAYPLLKKVIDEESNLNESILSLREILRTCLSVVATLAKDYIGGFHLLDVKQFNKGTLLQMKLSFSLEQIISIAKLVLEVECLEDCNESNSTFDGTIRYCVRCLQTVLTDSNTQVQVIGLQALKVRVQKGANTEDSSFLMFFAGELMTDIFTLIQKMLKNPMTKESVTIASECLSLMVLLQTMSRGKDCHRGYTNILLQAIVMVSLSTGDGFSPEVNDLRSTAIKLVSRLAQIPSSAIHFKDALLSMPPVHRQQLQGILRASVTPDKNETELKVPVLDVKIPKPAAESKEKPSAPPATVKAEENIVEEEEGDFSEDDWDAFQSFPVSANDAGDESKTENATEHPNQVEASRTEDTFDDDGIQEHSKSKSVNNAENPEEIKEEMISNTADVEMSAQSQPPSHELTTERCDIPSIDSTGKPQDIMPGEGEELEIHEVLDKEASIPGTELVSGDHLSDKETKESVEEKLEADILHKDHSLEQEASDSPVLKQEEIHEVHDKEAPIAGTELVSGDHLSDKETKLSVEGELEAVVYEVYHKEASIPSTELVSGDNLSDKETKGSVEGELEADILHKEHSLKQEASDSAVRKQSSSESDNNEQIRKCEDADKNDLDQNKGCEQQQDKGDDGPVESENSPK